MDYVDPLRALFNGVRGDVLSVVAATERPLTLKQLTERSGATKAMVSKRVDELVDLSVLCREKVGTSDQIYLSDTAIAGHIRRIGSLWRQVMTEMKRLAADITPPPANVTVFGSFARGTAGPDSDIDIVIVRPHDVPDDDAWMEAIGKFTDATTGLAGNPVADIHVDVNELSEVIERPLWQEIVRDGVTLIGTPIKDLVTR